MPYIAMPIKSEQLEFLLTFLAGIRHDAHRDAIEEFESWHDLAARKFQEVLQETRAAMQRME